MTIPLETWLKAWRAEYRAIERPDERAWFVAGAMIALVRMSAGNVFARVFTRGHTWRPMALARVLMGSLLLLVAVGNFVYDVAVPDRMGYFAWLLTVVFVVTGVLLLRHRRGEVRRNPM